LSWTRRGFAIDISDVEARAADCCGGIARAAGKLVVALGAELPSCLTKTSNFIRLVGLGEREARLQVPQFALHRDLFFRSFTEKVEKRKSMLTET
jgi:hypothetical protein